jgi:hypothetical protein
MEYAHNLLLFIKQSYSTSLPDGFEFANYTVIPTLARLEASGLHVDASLLQTYFGESSTQYVTNSIIHTEYNPYTSTGRPSNKYGGINFSALNKTNQSRETFTSRYGDDGLLIQFDYEAFHLRLVANSIGYTLPNSSVHSYLAAQYYGTTEITSEQYELSKQRTFSIMYGITEDVGDVEFFHKIRAHTEQLWNEYQRQGFIRSKTGKKMVLDTPSPNKVFNYMVQWMETEEAIVRIANVCTLLTTCLTKPILYTYDALLLDVHRSETALLSEIRRLLETNMYPTRMYKGKTYDTLESV